MGIYPIIIRFSQAPELLVQAFLVVPGNSKAKRILRATVSGAEANGLKPVRAEAAIAGLPIRLLPQVFITAGARAVLLPQVGAAVPQAEKAEAQVLRPADQAAEEGVDFSN